MSPKEEEGLQLREHRLHLQMRLDEAASVFDCEMDTVMLMERGKHAIPKGWVRLLEAYAVKRDAAGRRL